MAHPDGTPVWFEVTTPDQDKAQDFYTAVAGWQIEISPNPDHGGYRMANAPDGQGVAGLMKPPPGMEGMPTGWTIYFGVPDVDAAAEKVKALGGSVHVGPMDIPDVGRFAAAADPQGVRFNIMTGSSPEDSTAFKQVPPDSADKNAADGHGVWIELATPDPEGALAFYGELFGWSKQGAMPMGDMGDYVFVGPSQDNQPGAIMPSKTTGTDPHWDWYIQVPDIDAAVTTIRDKGGAVPQEPMQIPGGAYATHANDAQGYRVGIVGPRK